MVKKRKPYKLVLKIKSNLTKLIVRLGYTKEQGEAFAEGYAAKLAQFNDCFMTAGFVAAHIDEREALKRFLAINGASGERSNPPKKTYAFPIS